MPVAISDDLWPNFDVSSAPLSPNKIVEQAGQGLEKKTQGLVMFSSIDKRITDDSVEMTFSLYSRSLSYHFPFIRIKFPIVGGYPVELVGTGAGLNAGFRAANEVELVEKLGELFHSKATVDIIQRLISLSSS